MAWRRSTACAAWPLARGASRLAWRPRRANRDFGIYGKHKRFTQRKRRHIMASPAATWLGVHRLYSTRVRLTRRLSAGGSSSHSLRARADCTGRASWARDMEGPHPKYDTWVNRTQRFATAAPTLRFLRLVNDCVLLVDPLQLLLSPKRTRTNHETVWPQHDQASPSAAPSSPAASSSSGSPCPLPPTPMLGTSVPLSSPRLLLAPAERARLDMLERGRTEPPADEAPSKLTPRKGFATNELA